MLLQFIKISYVLLGNNTQKKKQNLAIILLKVLRHTISISLINNRYFRKAKNKIK